MERHDEVRSITCTLTRAEIYVKHHSIERRRYGVVEDTRVGAVAGGRDRAT